MDPTLLLTAVVVLVGALVQGMSGFGFGLVTMSLLPLFLPVDHAVPMVAAWGLALNLYLNWRLRKHISLRRAGPMMLGGLLGIPVGVLFLKGADPRLIKGALGAVIVLFCLHSLLSSRVPHIDEGGRKAQGLGVVAGAAGGVLGGAFNTGGPPVILYVAAMGWAKDAATSTIQVYFLLTTTLTIAGHVSVGLMTPERLWQVLPLYPVVGLGSWLGTRIYDRVPQARFRQIVLVLLLVLGANFLVRSALGV